MNALWQKVNREMVAKILAELEYSGRTLRAEPVRRTTGASVWATRAGFRATRGYGAGCILTLIP